MDRDPTLPTDADEDQVSSSINVAPKYAKNTSSSNPDDVSAPEESGDTEMLSPDNREEDVQEVPETWSSQNDEPMDCELNPREADIREFIENFKNFHVLMIQMNESKYYESRLNVAHGALEADLIDMLGELAYRRGEEDEELRQKAELDDFLKSIQDDLEEEKKEIAQEPVPVTEAEAEAESESESESESEAEADKDDSQRVAEATLDELIDIALKHSNVNDNNN